MVPVLSLPRGPWRHRDVGKVLPQRLYQTACAQDVTLNHSVCGSCLRSFEWAGARASRTLSANRGEVSPLHCFLVKVTTWEGKVQGRSWTELCPSCPHPPCAGPRSRCAHSALLRAPSSRCCQSAQRLSSSCHCPEPPKRPDGPGVKGHLLCAFQKLKWTGVSSVYLRNHWHF